MELKTTLNGASVTVEYEVEFDEVDCYSDGRDTTEVVMTVTVEAVMFKGIDILAVISDADVTALEMECTAAYDEVEA